MRSNEHTNYRHDCIVFVESIVATEHNTYEVYIDFRLQDDFKLFLEAFDLTSRDESGEGQSEHINDATIVKIINLKSSKRLRRSCYYKLNINVLREYTLNNVEDSFVIGYEFDLKKMKAPSDNELEILQVHDKLDPNELRVSLENRIESLLENFNLCKDYDTVFVKDVGQANWNEVWSRGHIVEVLFDAGAPLNASKNAVTDIFRTRERCLHCSKPTLILSHWDIDHIHCLKYLSQKDIQMCFNKLICVDNIKSLTATKIYEKFVMALGHNNVYALSQLSGRGTFSMINILRKGNVSIYHGRHCSNINYCGLIMFVKGKHASANFTGDARLSQANEVYSQEVMLGMKTNQHILIVPHHGGYFKPQFRAYSKPCQNILISVGKNNIYSHPNSTMLTYYKSLGIVERTDMVGDIIKRI